METRTEYKGFTYEGWQEDPLPENPDNGFNIYTCSACGTTISERRIPGHDCMESLKAKDKNTLDKLL